MKPESDQPLKFQQAKSRNPLRSRLRMAEQQMHGAFSSCATAPLNSSSKLSGGFNPQC